MSIQSEINRINTNIANAYDKCEEKGATMPDNENSANLADTIDSIPTGGGGKYDFIKAEALKIKEQVHKGDWTYPYESTSGHPETLVPNWHFYSTNPQYANVFSINYQAIFGMFFDKSAPSRIYIKIGQGDAFGVPDDATVTKIEWTQSSYEVYQVDFASDKYLWASMSMQSGIYGYQSHCVAFSPEFTNNTVGLKNSFLKYFCIVATSKNYYNNPCVVSSFHYIMPSITSTYPVSMLEDADFVDYKHVLDASNISLSHICWYHSPMSMIDYFVKLSQGALTRASFLTDTTLILSASNSRSWLTSTSYCPQVFGCTEFPAVFDLSTYSDTYIHLDSLTTASQSSTLQKHCPRLLLKNCAVNVYWQYNLTVENFRYFVQNASTVSNKTFYTSQLFIDTINASDSTLIPALQAKGWTVTTA